MHVEGFGKNQSEMIEVDNEVTIESDVTEEAAYSRYENESIHIDVIFLHLIRFYRIRREDRYSYSIGR